MSKEYDYIVYIGRFQPFHDGHMTTLEAAFEKAKKVIIVIGSSNAAPNPKNPLTADQRVDMILASVSTHPNKTDMVFVPVEDRWYKPHKWTEFVQSAVSDIAGHGKKIALIGHDKDPSSYYLREEFPMWDFVETGPYIKERNIGTVVSATKVRELMFPGHFGYTKSNLPLAVYDELESFMITPTFQNLQKEYDHYVAEEKKYENLPWGMNFLTVDSVVVQSGHILLVQRDTYPGNGLWALPGVHLGLNETFQQASIRALLSETNLDVPLKPLMGSLKSVRDFDHPDRSLRCRLTQIIGRTVTTAHYYELDSSRPLPTKGLKGGEGIRKAWWFSFSEAKRMRAEMFEDHADIIDYYIG